MNNKTISEKLVDFYEDLDFYGFRDTLEIGETKEDAAEKLASDLQDPKSIDLVIEELENIISEGVADENDVEVAKQLITELKEEKEQKRG